MSKTTCFSHVDGIAPGGRATTRERTFDVAVVGAGAAGITAALRVATAGFDVALVEGRDELGGEAAGMARLEAAPGFPIGLAGAELGERAAVALRQAGVTVRTGTHASSLGRRGDGWELGVGRGDPVRSRVVLAASGAGPELLDVPGVRRFSGAGVYAGVPATPPPGSSGATAFVTGSLPSAAQASLRLAAAFDDVVLLSPEPSIGRHLPAALVRAIRDTLRISVRPSVDLVELVGVRELEAIVLRDRKTGRRIVREAAALFIAGPARPASGWLAQGGARLQEGRVVTGERPAPEASPMRTSTALSGLFAAGAVRAGCEAGLAGAIADGLAAARDVIEFLAARPETPVTRC